VLPLGLKHTFHPLGQCPHRLSVAVCATGVSHWGRTPPGRLLVSGVVPGSGWWWGWLPGSLAWHHVHGCWSPGPHPLPTTGTAGRHTTASWQATIASCWLGRHLLRLPGVVLPAVGFVSRVSGSPAPTPLSHLLRRRQHHDQHPQLAAAPLDTTHVLQHEARTVELVQLVDYPSAPAAGTRW
jgi:hypothetical protein